MLSRKQTGSNLQWLLGAIVLLTLIGAIPTSVEAQTTDTEIDSLASVLVVPNPYVVTGRTWGPRSNIKTFERIRFANLPTSPCSIQIFSSRGNHIITLNHTGDGENLYWDGRNRNNQYVVSDVYLYVVESPTLGRHVGKFIIAR